MREQQTFSVDGGVIVWCIHQLVLHQAPSLASIFKRLPRYKRKFDRYCFEHIAERIKDTLQTNERETITYFEKTLAATFPELVDGFSAYMDKIQQGVILDKVDTTLGCPICAFESCDALLSCCKAPIHQQCNQIHQLHGYTTCSLCRRIF